MADEEPPTPFAILFEHTTGVRGLKFSSDGQWLCSIGDVHDGSILLWAINGLKASQVRLHARNKCNSYVNDLVWMGNDIVTVGTRHIKIWRPDLTSVPRSPIKAKWRSETIDSPSILNPALRALPGRNTLLGPLLDSCFTSVVALSDCKAAVASDRGQVCLLDTSSGSPSFSDIETFEDPVTCMCATGGSELWVGVSGVPGKIHRLELNESGGSWAPSTLRSPARRRSDPKIEGLLDPVAIGIIHNQVLVVDSERTVQVFGQEKTLRLRDKPRRRFWAHSGSIMGICSPPGPVNYSFVTWDSTGHVISWRLPSGQYFSSRRVELEQLVDQEEPNELRVLRFIEGIEDQAALEDSVDDDPLAASRYSAVCGDRYGIVTLLDLAWKSSEDSSLKAHDGEVNDVVHCDIPDLVLFASAGRDRVIQVFQKGKADQSLRLLQTLECHGSSVTRLLFRSSNKTLLSASTDRTVAISTLASNEEARAFIPTKIITLKHSPIGVALDADRPDHFVVSGGDKQVQRFDLHTYQQIEAFRPYDSSSGPVSLHAISSLNLGPLESCQRVVVGACANDRSIRVHDASSGATLVRDSGHTDGISDLAIFPDHSGEATRYTMVSTGLDGTVIIWNLSQNLPQPDWDGLSPVSKASTQPLRKILSKATIADLTKSLEMDGLALTPTPTRMRSPTRLHRKKSDFSLTVRGSKMGYAKSSDLPRSPSPPSIAEHKTINGRPKLAARPSLANIHNLRGPAPPSVEKLAKALRGFRRDMSQSKIDAEQLKELELELYLTQECMNKKRGRQSSIDE